MAEPIAKTLKRWEVAFRTSWGNDVSTPFNRFLTKLHFALVDQGLLRIGWRNESRVSPGVWRSNQPGPARFRALADRGFRTIVNLRGVRNESHYLLEEEAVRAAGLTLLSHDLHARAPNSRDELLGVIKTLRNAERPLLFHCKSGADRAGLAAALHLIANEGQSVEEARAQLGLAYLHLRGSKTGICDHFLDVYEARLKDGPIALEDWIALEYDPAALRESYARSKGGR